MAQALPHIERKLPLSSSYAHFSDVSNHLLDESFVLGVDEAGRGPAMGPMVYGIAYVPVSKKDELSHTGVADSKTLSEAQRTNLYAIMVEKKWVCWAVNVCSPGDISGAMLQIEKCSLNVVAQRATVELIRGVLKRNIRIEEVFVDTLGHPDKHRAFLESQIPGVKFTVAKKADSLYPIVSAASIFAKVTRDALLQNWKFIEPSLDASASKEFGSGYPGDPATKKWLNDHIDPVFGFPSIIRFSWSTCERLLEKNAARITWKEDIEDEAQDIRVFFAPDPSKKRKVSQQGLSSQSKTRNLRKKRSRTGETEEGSDAEDVDDDGLSDGAKDDIEGDLIVKRWRRGGPMCQPSIAKRCPLLAGSKLQNLVQL